MIIRVLLICLFVMIFSIVAGTAGAQSSCYRHSTAYVSAPINVRLSHSTASAVIRGAVAGESFAVSSSTQGKSYCWLNISEGWIAWTVRVSAVAPGGTTAPAGEQTTQPSNVDNCCFVDRQCHTDKEWTDGYWAYQRKQCPVNPPTTQGTSGQQVSSTQANVDNCCFIGWQCHTNQDWIDGYWAHQNNQCGATGQTLSQTIGPSFSHILSLPLPRTPSNAETLSKASMPFDNCCYIHHPTCQSDEDWSSGYWAFQNGQCIGPAPPGTRPEIVGNASFVSYASRALELIGIHAPEWLNYLYHSGIRKLEMHPDAGAGGFYNTIWVVMDGFHERFDPTWTPSLHQLAGYAGGVIHEACHAFQQRTYTQSAGWTNEIACVEAQLAVIEAIKPDSSDVPWLRSTIANIRNPEQWWWD